MARCLLLLCIALFAAYTCSQVSMFSFMLGLVLWCLTPLSTIFHFSFELLLLFYWSACTKSGNWEVMYMVWYMVFNANFNNISVISWRSILLMEETGVPLENHRPVTSLGQTFSNNVLSRTPRQERGSNSQFWWS